MLVNAVTAQVLIMACFVIALLATSAVALDEQNLRARSSDLEHRSGGRHDSFAVTARMEWPSCPVGGPASPV